MVGLPSGTVTFLFTDIEGSTALWERDRTVMASVVERHLRPLREGVVALESAVRMSDDRTLIVGSGSPGILASLAAA
jgi:class 3 adenylate cyclase